MEKKEEPGSSTAQLRSVEKMNTLDDLKIDRATRRVKRRRSWLIPSVSVLLLMGAVAIAKWPRERMVQVRSAVVREVQSTKRGTVLNGSGYIVARRVATPSSKITGKVTEVLVEEGMRVRKGNFLHDWTLRIYRQACDLRAAGAFGELRSRHTTHAPLAA
jgi:multidrug resistance efflux pump